MTMSPSRPGFFILIRYVGCLVNTFLSFSYSHIRAKLCWLRRTQSKTNFYGKKDSIEWPNMNYWNRNIVNFLENS